MAGFKLGGTCLETMWRPSPPEKAKVCNFAINVLSRISYGKV